MKKFSLIILLIFISVCNAQNSLKTKKMNKSKVAKEFLIEKDIKTVKDSKFCMETLMLDNADEKKKPAKITIACDTALYRMSKMNADKLNKIITNANIQSMFAVKNRYTYESKSMVITYQRLTDKWEVDVEYVAQNDYGALKDGFMTSVFNNNGEFLFMK